MKWYRNLYLGEGAKQAKYKMFGRIRRGRFQLDTYLITLSDNPDNLLDMFSANVLKQPYFKKQKGIHAREIYVVGQGVGMDKEKSSYWYKKSADLGYVHSMRDIGQNYLHGYGVEENAELAAQYFRLASENNYSHGTTDLAYCYLKGVGVHKDLAKAEKLYLLALKQDSERTMRDLISLCIDVKALLAGRGLCILDITSIEKIYEQNC